MMVNKAAITGPQGGSAVARPPTYHIDGSATCFRTLAEPLTQEFRTIINTFTNLRTCCVGYSSLTRAAGRLLVLLLAVLFSRTAPAQKIDNAAATTFNVTPALVTTVTGLLQTTGLSTPVTIPNYPLPGGRTASATLQAFPLWDDNAEISVLSGKERLGSGRPRLRTQLLGRIKDPHATTVQLRQTDEGLTGFVIYDGRLHRHTFVGNRVTFAAMDDTAGDPSLGHNVCALDQPPSKTVIGTPLTSVGPRRESLTDYFATLDPVKPPSAADALAAFCCVGAPGGQALKFFDVAVETDDELMIRFNYSSLAIQRHVTDLIAAVNAIYWDADTRVLFRLRWFHIYQAGYEGRSFDIFEQQDFMEQGNSFDRVAALRDLWNNNPDRVAKTRINRDIALLISGTNLGGSSIFPPQECVVNGQSTGQSCSNVPGLGCGTGTCQWVGEPLCRKDKAYAAISYYDFALDPLESQINDTAHELGHLFGAEHAHCTDTLTPPSSPPADPIDRCRSGGTTWHGGSCWTGTAQPPPNNTDTVMSICASQWVNVQHGLVFHPRSAQIIHDAAFAGTCGKPATVVLVQNGQRIPNLQSTSMPGRFYFAIDVPAGQSQLEIETQGSGELKLYARYGTLPTTWGTLVASVPGTANQRIVVPTPRAGRWYISMFGWNPFWGVELRAEYSP
jgi:hypothetical protein